MRKTATSAAASSRGSAALARHDLGPTLAEPALQGVGRRLAERHLALLGALAPHGQGAGPQSDVGQVQPAQLPDPQTAAVEHLQHRIVAEAQRGRIVVCPRRRLVQQHVQLRSAQHPRQPALAGRRAERPRRIHLDGADVAEPTEVAPQCRGLAGDAARRVRAGV